MYFYDTDVNNLITRKDELELVRKFHKAEAEVAKFMLDDILQALTEVTIRPTYKGLLRVNPHYSRTMPFVGTHFIQLYLRDHAEGILKPVPEETRNGLVYKVTHNPWLQIGIGYDAEEAYMGISLMAVGDIKGIIKPRVIAEASKEIIGLTKKEVINRYNDPYDDKDIRYYALCGEEKIMYRGFHFDVRFKDDIVTALYDRF